MMTVQTYDEMNRRIVGILRTGNEASQYAAQRIEELERVERAARALIQIAADNVHTLATRGYKSLAFRAATDQWHAAYGDLRRAVQSTAEEGGE
jgi:hypothetical protein